MPNTPEDQARAQIENQLIAAVWVVQDVATLNLAAGPGIAVREFPLKQGHGKADYLLYGGKKALGIIEAKKEGDTLTGVEVQTEKYSTGLPANIKPWHNPLPFLYQSTGIETCPIPGLSLLPPLLPLSVYRHRNPVHQRARSGPTQPPPVHLPSAGNADRVGAGNRWAYRRRHGP